MDIGKVVRTIYVPLPDQEERPIPIPDDWPREKPIPIEDVPLFAPSKKPAEVEE